MIDAIIDTDPGHDDALAIMLAANSGLFKIHALTTVAGNSTIENTTRNARFVLKLLGREDIPVYSGEGKPLARGLIQAVVHGKSGLEGLDPTNEPELTGNAVEKILQTIKENPGKITLIALGPLTNVAKAIQKSPETMAKAKEIVMMIGAVRVHGNKSRTAEFNAFVDPEAADIVFRFPCKKTMVPLDACNHVKLQLEDFEQVKGSLKAPVLAMMKPFIENISKDEGVKAALMYDPLTVYSIMNPQACTKKEYDIVVETKGEHTSGMTVAELRGLKAGKPNITVVESIAEAGFKKDFVNCLSK